MSRYVIDASVAVKWVIQEVHQDSALQYLKKEFFLLVPSLFIIECASAIQNQVRLGKLSEEDGWNAYVSIRNYQLLKLVPFESLLYRAYQIANDLCHAMYDCIYLALAENQNAIMVTADRKLYERVASSDYKKLIAWIEDTPRINE